MATTTCITVPTVPATFLTTLAGLTGLAGGLVPATTATEIAAILALLNQVNTLAALCPTFCSTFLACTFTGTGFVTGLTTTGLISALNAFFAANGGVPTTGTLGDFGTALGLIAPGAGGTGLAPVVAALQTCINNALAGCFGTPVNPGNLFCPGLGGSPISIQITNTARNDDQDQITTQAGKGNNADQDQKFITAAAGDDVVINGFKKRFDEFDEKLRFLLCKLKEDNKKQCKCKKSGCKY